MKVYNAMQLKNGAKADIGYSPSRGLVQPIQFLPAKEKTEDWFAHNIDWLEIQGLDFLAKNARKLLKNYKLAKGIIDKKDYIVEENNDYKDLVDILTEEDETALELKFYPIIPNVINVLTGEFSKRHSKIQFRAVDDISYNEMLEQKKAFIEQTLLAEAEQKLMLKMLEMGMDPESDEVKQQLSPDNLKTLPEIESYFTKNYRSSLEEWATHQHHVDEERFKLQELEEQAFEDMLTVDREFWHFKMLEDDYDMELWNPVLTFYQKSPSVKYISEAAHVGKIDLMTIADVIDKYGYLMTTEQLESLQSIYPAKSALYPIQGYQNDGTFYDPTKSHAWNVNPPGLAYRQFMTMHDSSNYRGDVVAQILGEGEDVNTWGEEDLLRVTTVYWKTQRKLGHLIRITEEGEMIQELIDETYKLTEKPIYDTSLFKNKTKDNLVQGEHVDWIWINETVGGVKIGPNVPAHWQTSVANSLTPIYLGINRKKPGRLPFQFKGDKTLYGCKLPVEGRVFSDRNTKSTSLVDLMKPSQIGFNMVNNQIADILIDELGTVILFDQNSLPRHSMGEDWGKGNYAKAYVAMKNFSMLPLDTSLANTENPTNFQHYQTLNLEQTNRLLSRIQLATYFKQQAFEAIGINNERLGAPMGQQTATGYTQSLNQSYAQTEKYFTQHSDHLMPRVHQMRTDLAQFYNSTKPSLRLSYITTNAEKINFSIEGTDLLLRDFNVFATVKTNHRAVLDQLKQLALNNNTTDASIYDLGNMIKAESIAEITGALKAADERTNRARQQQMEQERQMQEQALAMAQQEMMMKLQHESNENEKDRQKDILVAEIRAAGYGADSDINENKVSDYQDAMKDIKQDAAKREEMNFKKEQAAAQNSLKKSELDIKREQLAAQREIADKQLQIARENKNRFDDKKSSNKK